MIPDARAIEHLFPAGVRAAVAPPGPHPALDPAEIPLTVRMAPRRLADFTAGRGCARAALARLGVAAGPLIPDPRGEPRWPAGVVGSISHCEGFCAAVAARRAPILGLGFDAEPREPLPADLLAEVCTSGELAWTAAMDPGDAAVWRRVAFSAKESLFKCCFPMTGLELDFQEVEVALESPQAFHATLPERLRAALGPTRLEGRYLITPTLILTGTSALG